MAKVNLWRFIVGVPTLRATLLLIPLLAGCGPAQEGKRIYGKVSFAGKPVQQGEIQLYPIEGTKGPSTGGAITDGSYEIPAQVGPRANGIYQVQLFAEGEETSYNPNPSGQGPSITIRKPLLSSKYNTQSKLKLTVSATDEANHHNFNLAE